MTTSISRGPSLPTLYERLGERAFFDLSRAFYRRAAEDEILGPMLPRDVAPAARRQALFLAQFFGGPTTYSDERGHPRLRARHMPFRVDREARDRWMRLMTEALDEVGVDEPARAQLLDYFEHAATFLVNTASPAADDGAAAAARIP